MQDFGPHIALGGNVPFETTIELRTSAPGQDTTLQNASGPSERRKALEEAARVCEKVSGLYEPYLDSAFDSGGFTAAVRCADLLRHLAQQGD
jgi:hypothetical protein